MASLVALRLSCLLASASAAPTLFGEWPTLRQSKVSADADAWKNVTFMGTTGLASYPGYAGNLSMTGDIYIMVGPAEPSADSADGEWRIALFFSLFDTDPSCSEGVSRIRVSGSCSISLHTGNKCEEVGDAFSISTSLPQEVLYTTVNRSSQNAIRTKLESGASGALSALAGRTVVVRDAAGTRVACAPLRHMQAAWDYVYTVQEWQSEWQSYPGYEGKLRVTGAARMLDLTVGGEPGQLLEAFVAAADPECASGHRTGIANSCGIHVHEGKTCADAAAIGGHLYNRSMWASGEDPWENIRYVTQDSSLLTGAHRLQGTAQTAMTGLAATELEGRALVVHDATGARIACALVPTRARSESDAH